MFSQQIVEIWNIKGLRHHYKNIRIRKIWYVIIAYLYLPFSSAKIFSKARISFSKKAKVSSIFTFIFLKTNCPYKLHFLSSFLIFKFFIWLSFSSFFFSFLFLSLFLTLLSSLSFFMFLSLSVSLSVSVILSLSVSVSLSALCPCLCPFPFSQSCPLSLSCCVHFDFFISIIIYLNKKSISVY